MIDGLIEAGAPEQVIAAARSSMTPPETHCEVWPDNWPTLTFFLSLNTQWQRVIGLGGQAWLGIPSTAIESEMCMQGIARKRRPALLASIRLMEHAALAVLNKVKE